LAAERVNFYYLSGDVRGFEQWIDELTLPFLRSQFSRRSFDNAHAWAAFKTAELLAMSAKPVEAKAFYEDAINLGPYIFDFQVKYANYLVRNSLYSEAITHYQRVLANRPMSKMANGNLGYAYLLLGMEDSARFYLESALRLDPYYESAQANLQLLNR
jgi:tetratricopeptide (TPR) repeat protein